MKKTLPGIQIFLLLFLFSLLPSSRLTASHVMAQEITYECIGTCQYRFHWKAYRDCSGANVIIPDSTKFVPVAGTNCGTPTVVTGWNAVQFITNVTPVCPLTLTSCNSITPVITGIQEYKNSATYDFCSTSCAFRLTWDACCRNSIITSGAGNNLFYVDETIIDPTLTTCNNSPVFTSSPAFFVCIGDTTVVHQGCYDPDGDSLSYSLEACKSSDTSLVWYNNGYSYTQPLGSSWTMEFDSTNGNMSFLPTPGAAAIGVICVLVKEWRNGQLIGQLWRDVQVASMSCNNNQNPGLDSLVMVNGGVANGFNVAGALAGQPVCFDLYASDPNNGQMVSLFWDGNVANGSFVDPNNVTITDTIMGTNPVGRFCFTPAQGGNYQFLVTAEDDVCPVAGYEDRFINIQVDAYGVVATTSLNSCLDIQFGATAVGGNGSYTYTWTGTGGLNTTGQTFAHTYPGPGTYTYSVIATDGAGFNSTDNGSITVTNVSAAPLIGPYGMLDCQPDSVQLTASGVTGATYLWSTGETTTSIWTYASGSYSVIATDPSGCMEVDTAQVQDTITTFIEGLALDYFLAGLNQQKVYLIHYDATDSSLTAFDSVLTDAAGNFRFDCPTEYSTWYLKAAPDSAVYPTTMPTYYDTSLVWQDALPYTLPNNLLAVIRCRQGGNPGGPGFVGGLITQGANKQSNPIANLRLFLMDDAGAAAGYAETNADGYFSFPNLAQGKYAVWVDKPFINNAIAPEIEVGPQSQVQDSLDFLLHSTYLELNALNGREEAQFPQPVIHLAPNPFTENIHLQLDLPKATEVTLTLRDLQGRRLASIHLGRLVAGKHTLEFSNWASLPGGLYIAEVRSEHYTERIELVKASGE